MQNTLAPFLTTPLIQSMCPYIGRLLQDSLRTYDNASSTLSDIDYSSLAETLTRWQPYSDTTDNETTYQVSVELPGCRKEDVTIEVSGRNLVISGEKTTSTTPPSTTTPTRATCCAMASGVAYCTGGSVHERYHGHYSRSFPLPDTADVEHVSATFTSGVLTVSVPKIAPRNRQVLIN